MAHALLYKRPSEVEFYQFDFTDLFAQPGTDTKITTSSRVVVTDSAGNDQTALIVQSTNITAFTLQAYLANGLDGEDYLVEFTGAGDTTKQINSRLLELRVRSKIAGNL